MNSHARPHGAPASSNTASRPFALSQVIDIGLDASSKKDGEEKLALLRKNADDISLGLDEIDAELDDESKLEEEGDDDSDDEAGMTPEDKVAKHKAKWQKRAEKYRKYADKGKVDKLQRANEKQTHKLQKVRARALPSAAPAFGRPRAPPRRSSSSSSSPLPTISTMVGAPCACTGQGQGQAGGLHCVQAGKVRLHREYDQDRPARAESAEVRLPVESR